MSLGGLQVLSGLAEFVEEIGGLVDVAVQFAKGLDGMGYFRLPEQLSRGLDLSQYQPDLVTIVVTLVCLKQAERLA